MSPAGDNSRKFARRMEDFICGHCGRKVPGGGYTNHCPACLWSRHVDVNPGDRLAECGGLMEPIRVELRKGEYRILQRCVKCGHQRWNRASADDDFEALLRVARHAGEGGG